MPGIVAPRTYYPPDLIYEEEAFAWVLPRKLKDENCDYCCKSSESDNLIPCKECSLVKYCGIECQEKGSILHRMECENMHKLEDILNNEDFIRLLARVIFKIKGKDWKSITRNVMGTEVSFDDIDSHYEETMTNQRLFLCYKGVKASLHEFIGEEIIPDDEDLIRIVGKVKYSGCYFDSNCNMFCFGVTLFGHECIPNSNIESVNNVLKIWAIKKINAGAEKISVSMRNILTTDYYRSTINNDTLEVCHCTECSLPYGESVLTKIIDDRHAYTVIKQSENLLRKAEVLSNLDLENDLRFKVFVDVMLGRQEGVLAPTNALHLKVLALKAMLVDGINADKRSYLIQLEERVRAVFGDYYSELVGLYKALVLVNFKLDHKSEVSRYMKKIEKLEVHRSED